MSNNLIVLKSISELEGMTFFIPRYQRGYRWDRQQVVDLLDDINSFDSNCNGDQTWYCLQPLSLKSRSSDVLQSIKEADSLEVVLNLLKGNWEVIDGQQRLTTVYILLSYLGWGGMTSYSLEYETRPKSKSFLESIATNHDFCPENTDNIDYYHIIGAWTAIAQWFEEHGTGRDSTVFREKFRNKVLNQVKFIWYESAEKDSVEVFNKLNSGRIALTNAELIKALFLNKSNFKVEDVSVLSQQQREIAAEWDRIEYALQDDEFWYFLNNVERESRDTRIEYIFDIACKINAEGLPNDLMKTVRLDSFRTFDYFYKYFHQVDDNVSVLDIWGRVRQIFNTFVEWYTDLTLYHYVGYLITCNTSIVDILKKWNGLEDKDKNSFVASLKKDICAKIANCKDLGRVYEVRVPVDPFSGHSKTTCRPLLLLHNIQTVVIQYQKEREKYGQGAFYRFPFHLYKLEKWDVEHIDSNTENDLSEEPSRKEYLINIYNGVEQEDKKKIEGYFTDGKPDWSELSGLIAAPQNALKGEIDKNQIWNFTLLDSSTNRSYGNAIFSAKRRIIIGKDKGENIPIPKCKVVDGKTILTIDDCSTPAYSTFIPPCTKHVFLKYYSAFTSDPNYWDRDDAESYRKSIYDTLKEFGVTLSVNGKESEQNGKDVQ